jgi:hypothetical protein
LDAQVGGGVVGAVAVDVRDDRAGLQGALAEGGIGDDAVHRQVVARQADGGVAGAVEARLERPSAQPGDHARGQVHAHRAGVDELLDEKRGAGQHGVPAA